MLRKIALTFVLLSFGLLTTAQELRCNIQVISSQVQGTNRQVFQTLQSELFEFMNNRAWTEHIYSNEERIECNILINIQEQIGNEFSGSIQIQSRRPVYNSSYNSSVFNYKDNDVKFEYIEYEPLEFSLSENKSNLTSMLAYYAYIIIGLDYDTFSEQGGTPYFQNAERIVNNAQNAPEKGWKAFEGRKNRYWLVENLLNNDYKDIRTFLYRYHRHGLDKMHEEAAEGRAEIAESLELLQEVYREKPDPFMFLFELIVDIKSDEIVNVFSESFPEEINRVQNIMVEIDPSHADRYEKLKQ